MYIDELTLNIKNRTQMITINELAHHTDIVLYCNRQMIANVYIYHVYLCVMCT